MVTDTFESKREDARVTVERFAEEHLRLGYAPSQVMSLFRSTHHVPAHDAWHALGDEAVTTIVWKAALVWSIGWREHMTLSGPSAPRPGSP